MGCADAHNTETKEPVSSPASLRKSKGEKVMKVMQWKTKDCDELPVWYVLDEPGADRRFFQDLLNNAELDGREEFSILEMSQEEYDKRVVVQET